MPHLPRFTSPAAADFSRRVWLGKSANLYVAVEASQVAPRNGPWCVEFAGSWKCSSQPTAVTSPEDGYFG